MLPPPCHPMLSLQMSEAAKMEAACDGGVSEMDAFNI